MKAIRIRKACAVRGKPLKAGDVVEVGSEVSQDDAVVLMRMGRAEEAVVVPKRRKGKSDEHGADE